MKMKRWMKCLMMVLMLTLSVGAGVAGIAVPVAAKTKTAAVKKGTTFWSGNYQYKITSLKGKKGTAALISTKSKKLSSVNVPETVKKGKYTLTVTAIGDGAFKNCKKLKTVTTNASMKTIGKSAFSGCKKLQKIDIKGTKLKEVGKNALKGIAKKAVIQVPEKSEKSYGKLFKGKGQSSAACLTASETETTKTISAPEPTSAPQPQIVAPQSGKAPQLQTVAPKLSNASTIGETLGMDETSAASSTPSLEPGPTPNPTPDENGLYHMSWHEGHALEKIEDTEATCTEPGCVHVDCYRCTVCENTEFHAIKDKDHIDEEKPALGHDWSEPVVEKEPTCTQSGLKVKTCKRCDAREEEVIPATLGNHKFGEWVVTVEANCITVGEKVRICEICGTKETEPIFNAKHNFEPMDDIKPTCEMPGRVHRTRCTVCGEESFGMGAKALGHDWGEPVVEKEATCTTPGLQSRHCTREGCTATTDVEEIPATGHTWESEKTDATCTSYGYTLKSCTKCGATETTDRVAPTGHQWGDEIVTEATCGLEGTHKKVCEKCGAEKVLSVTPATGHDWVLKEKVPATCGKDGYEIWKCKHEGCNLESKKTLPMTSDHHRWVLEEDRRGLSHCADCGKTFDEFKKENPELFR